MPTDTQATPAAVKPTAPVAPTVPVGPTPEQIKADLAKLEAARQDIQRKERQHVLERRKFSTEREAEKKTWGEKLSRLEALEKAHAQAKINPEAFLREVYGDKWYDTVVAAKLNNGIPTADVLASEISKAEERIEKKFQEREAERAKADAEAIKQRGENARRQLNAEAADFWKANEKDYPIFKRLGDEAAVTKAISQRIESEYYRTEKRDEETGELLVSGRVLTVKEAADAIESEMLAIAEEAIAHDKYKPKFQEKLAPQKQQQVVSGAPKLQRPENQQRRTLSNDLTGSTPGRQPPASPEEKRQRAIARFNELHSKAPS